MNIYRLDFTRSNDIANPMWHAYVLAETVEQAQRQVIEMLRDDTAPTDWQISNPVPTNKPTIILIDSRGAI